LFATVLRLRVTADSDDRLERRLAERTRPPDRPHYMRLYGRWWRCDGGVFTPMPSGWQPGKHPHNVK
jgi:hypothetical protein